jgi:hypothetical protein
MAERKNVEPRHRRRTAGAASVARRRESPALAPRRASEVEMSHRNAIQAARRERLDRLRIAVATRTYHPDPRAVAAAVLERAGGLLLH